MRKGGLAPCLRPDGKTQVTVEYGDDGRPARIDTVVISTQHDPEAEPDQIREGMIQLVIRPVIPAELLDENTRIYVNPTGRFVVGGPQGDSGLTGRKIIVDTYGGSAPHGGGSFWAAKNVVAAGRADRCQIQLAYAIGVARPVSVRVDTFGTGTVPDEALERAVSRVFDFRPSAIIEWLGLRRPIYRQTAAYGHFGRPELDLPWERTDRVDELLAAL